MKDELKIKRTEAKSYKAFNFDFDTNKLQQHTGSKTRPYYEIGRSMKELGFEHRQGSGYVSLQKLSISEVNEIIYKLAERHEWLSHCVKEFDVTNVLRRQYSLKNAISEMSLEIDEKIKSNPLYAMRVNANRKKIGAMSQAVEDQFGSVSEQTLSNNNENKR